MEYTCDECYKMRQKSIVKCPRCQKESFECRVIGISAVNLCRECGCYVLSAGGFPEACHDDKNQYSIMINNPNDNAKLVKLAKILNFNVLDLKNGFLDNKLTLQNKLMDCIEMEKELSNIGISCAMDSRIKKEFPRIYTCPYANGVYEDTEEFELLEKKAESYYNTLFEQFTSMFPGDKKWFEEKCKENQAFPEDGMHVIFGMVVVPFLIEVAINDSEKLKKAFDFFERMETFGTSKIAEVIEFSVLENLIGVPKDRKDILLKYMGKETREVFIRL